MICPQCTYDNVPGSEVCARCQQDLTQLDVPVAHDRVERSLMEDAVRRLRLRTPITVSPEQSIHEAVGVMLQTNVGALLVLDSSGKLVGIFSERDLLLKVAGDNPPVLDRPVREVMTANPETVTPDDSLAFVLHKMDVGGYRHVPVVDQGQPLGVISVRDMLHHLTRLCLR